MRPRTPVAGRDQGIDAGQAPTVGQRHRAQGVAAGLPVQHPLAIPADEYIPIGQWQDLMDVALGQQRLGVAHIATHDVAIEPVQRRVLPDPDPSGGILGHSGGMAQGQAVLAAAYRMPTHRGEGLPALQRRGQQRRHAQQQQQQGQAS